MVSEREFKTEINTSAERKVQAPTHRASGVSAVGDFYRFLSFVGGFIGGENGMRKRKKKTYRNKTGGIGGGGGPTEIW